ncbi:uncharacterized protein JCM6883_001895 [Sporobolomyces salmoneus]|uniref:uncharacterized protein n=1 Tax=Sporobolomyces salmoneus TaxID=183962 RepID=UPI0031777979
MPVPIPDSFPSTFPHLSTTTSSGSIGLSPSAPASVDSAPSPTDSPIESSSALIEERFLCPSSALGIWTSIKGYTSHLSPIGQRYSRERFNFDKIGALANHYRETLSPGSAAGGGAGVILKVEAMREGKVLATVNTRLTKEEEEVYNDFIRKSADPVNAQEEEAISIRTTGASQDDHSRTTRQPSNRRQQPHLFATNQSSFSSSTRLPPVQPSRSLTDAFDPSILENDRSRRETWSEEEEGDEFADLPPLVEATWVPSAPSANADDETSSENSYGDDCPLEEAGFTYVRTSEGHWMEEGELTTRRREAVGR